MTHKIILVVGAVASLAMSSNATFAQQGKSPGFGLNNGMNRAPQAGTGPSMRPWTVTHSGTTRSLNGTNYYSGRFIFRQAK
jgi:hypothetical protein